MRRSLLLIVLLSAIPLAIQPDRVSGQRSEHAPPPPVSERLQPTEADVRLAPDRSRFERALASDGLEAELPQARNRSGIPFMAAGGALFVAGAIAGDTAGALMMVGGGVAGAYGLFVYFGGDVEQEIR